MRLFLLIQALCALLTCVRSKIWNVVEYGIISADATLSTSNSNTKIINRLLNELLRPGDTLLIPFAHHFWFNGGIFASSMQSITIQIDGAIHYQHHREDWPTEDDSDRVLEAMQFVNSRDIQMTSSRKEQKGMINGHGNHWWGAMEYCEHKENRPRLLHIRNSTDLVIEHLFFKDSPYWNVYLDDVRNVEVHHTKISAKRDDRDYHDLFDLTAFNTDGIDVSGEDVWIHDVDIWTDDDCIAVKAQSGSSFQSDCSRNMLFEGIRASGLGLTIGSVRPKEDRSCIDNITFRDAFLKNTWKGIYMKSAPAPSAATEAVSAVVSNILYENIVMDEPRNVPIWIGPQQAIYEDQCSLLWPYSPWAKCPVTPFVSWLNITLRNITINAPKQSPGLLMGSRSNPMRNITFDNVVVRDPGMCPWGTDYYKCRGVEQFTAINGTDPVPQCGRSEPDLHGVGVATTWQQNLEDIPGLDKYLGLMMCLKHSAKQNKLASSAKPVLPESIRGREHLVYQEIEYHAADEFSMEDSLALVRLVVVFLCLGGCASYLWTHLDDL